MHMVNFLFAGIYVRIDYVVKCPACMQAYLGQRLPLSLLLANLLSPIVLVWWVVLVFRTFSRWQDKGPVALFRHDSCAVDESS